ncbi:rCG30333, partial [Rattus norvegicus]
MCFHCL